MQYKVFHGRQVSRLGLGCLRFPMAGENRIDRVGGQVVIDAAIEAGINYFDTAAMYQNGDSERFLGEALTKYPRESYLLATKYMVDVSAPKKNIAEVFEEQLRRCRTDYFDVYMFHGLDERRISLYTDKQLGYLDYLLKQKEKGRIRHLGFSSHAAPATLRRFLEVYSGYDMALIQLNYIDWTAQEGREQYDILTEYGIPVWVMEPLKGGKLATLNEAAADILKAAAPERSLASWGMRFLMSLPNVQTVLSGMSDVAQVRDNAATFSDAQPLSEEEMVILKKAAAAYLKEMGVPCSACRYCCPTCPSQLDIPLLLKGYNHLHFNETWKVEGLSSARGPEECIGCGECLKHCPQRIDIPAALADYARRKKEN